MLWSNDKTRDEWAFVVESSLLFVWEPHCELQRRHSLCEKKSGWAGKNYRRNLLYFYSISEYKNLSRQVLDDPAGDGKHLINFVWPNSYL